jgi:hypothetical protein
MMAAQDLETPLSSDDLYPLKVVGKGRQETVRLDCVIGILFM